MTVVDTELIIVFLLGLILLTLWGGIALISYLKQKQKTKFVNALKFTNEPIILDSNGQEALVMKSINDKSLSGYYSSKRKLYIPSDYLKTQIDHILDQRGIIDLYELIEQQQIPDEYLGAFVRGYLSKDLGFWDLLERRFFTYQKATEKVLETLSNVSAIPIRELLFNLGGWKDDDLIEVLGELADQERFRGFLDTQNILYVVYIDSRITNEDKQLEETLITKYIKENLKTKDIITFNTIFNVFRRDFSYFQELIKKLRKQAELDIIFTRDNDLVSKLDLYEQLILDISTKTQLDFEDWADQWNLSVQEIKERIKLLDGLLLEGIFTEDGYKGNFNLNQFKTGLDFKQIQTQLDLTATYAAQLLGRLYVNKGMIPVYQDGMIQNMEDTKKSWHCTKCEITFVVSKEIEEPKICSFCKNMKLMPGSSKPDNKFVDPRLKGVVRDLIAFQNSGIVIKLDSILRDIDLPQNMALDALQDLIFRGIVKGKIDLSRQVFLTRQEGISGESKCYICDKELIKSDIPFRCKYCRIQLCDTCSLQVRELGVEVCPLCGKTN
ncbi:MAG: hypothetical protein ACFFCQ_06550 [Promethearchaeota archaeon]